MTRRAVILGGVRTPFIRSGGSMEPLSAADLGRLVLLEALARTALPRADVQQVVLGCAGMPSDSANVARVAALRAGLDVATPALTVQRNCASGMEAVAQAALLVESGRADVVLCGGTESMSNYAMEFPRSFRRKIAGVARAKSSLSRLSAFSRFRPRDFAPEFGLKKGLTDPTRGLDMGQTAEVLARELSISRREQDEYALRSHQRAALAQAQQRFGDEIVPVVAPGKGELLVKDDAVRADQSLEKLGRLKPAFERRHGTVTPGNACGITDGACALVVTSEEWARERGREPLAAIRGWTVAGVAPERMGLGPAAALPRALAQAGWRLGDLGLVEINEAFAVQVLACLKVLADGELMRRHAGLPEAAGELRQDVLNVNGGAIALGHPVGVSGARLVLTLGLEMKRRGVARGAATLCVGGGQGQAVLLEAV